MTHLGIQIAFGIEVIVTKKERKKEKKKKALTENIVKISKRLFS